MNDDDLKSLLKTWEAPRAPATLRARIEAKRASERPWWSWLWAGEIRIPVPVALALLALLTFGVYRATWPAPEPSLTDFQQVRQFEPRLVRINYETAR